MLKAKAEIVFTLEGRNYSGKNVLRPAFNFGEDLLFSGQIKGDTDKYLYNQEYDVDIDFFTIEGEAYEAVQPLLKVDMDLAIQEGSRIIGLAKLVDFAYEQ